MGSTGRCIGLLERFEDNLLFSPWDPDSSVGHRKGDRGGSLSENRIPEPLYVRIQRHLHLNITRIGELAGVRQQVLEDLLEPLWISRNRGWNLRVDLE